MLRWEVTGGQPLNGKIKVQGSKNAVLPIMAGSLLHEGKTIIHNCPMISDVFVMLEILKELGCRIFWDDHTVSIDASEVSGTKVPVLLGEKMRSSVVLLGSLLGRNKKAVLPYPGGCTIGKRPIDIHMENLSKMGVVFEEEEDFLRAEVNSLRGTSVLLRFPSVGATENLLLAAVKAEGETALYGVAKEPEIDELCRFLRGMGAKIRGEGTGKLFIEGVEKLHDNEYVLCSDRIVTGTYLFGAAITKGKIRLSNAPVSQLQEVINVLRRMGAVLECTEDEIRIDGGGANQAIPYIKTEIYPGFPTDLQSQLMASLLVAEGESEIEETIFEERFHVVREFQKMGADITIYGKNAHIRGVGMLHEAEVTAKELRGGASLVLAALAARGTTIIRDDGYIRRGYEALEKDLSTLGAEICVKEYGG